MVKNSIASICKLFFIFIIIMFGVIPIASAQERVQQLLDHSIQAIHMPKDSNLVFQYKSVDSNLQDYQSDRTYPPFFSAFSIRRTLFYPNRGIEVVHSRYVFPGYDSEQTTIQTLNTAHGVYYNRKGKWMPVPSSSSSDMNLNPVAVLLEWKKYKHLILAGKRMYRDFPRIVLEHKTDDGIESLYLDPETFFPVKYEKPETHFLWGDVNVAYIYSTWLLADYSYFPGASFKMVDGNIKLSRTHSTMQFVSKDTLDAVAVPQITIDKASITKVQKPDTIQVAHNLYMLQNQRYNEMVALIDSTVYLFDATEGQDRAAYDHEWIRKLFPGDHPVKLVVTDLAWPHIGGLRYWVSKKAAVYAHQTSKSFLSKVVARRWKRHPDQLEKNRGAAIFKFKGVDDTLSLEDGKIRLYTIGGIGSEGALMVYLPDKHFLWASDYIQRTDQPTAYATEVWKATQKYSIKPVTVAAEHLKPTRWKIIQKLQSK